MATFELAYNSPFFDQPIIDSSRYDQLARVLTSSWTWPESKAFLQPPGYPYFLAIIYRIFGTSYLWARIVQATLGACTCVLIADLGKQLTQKTWLGWFSGLCVAFYGPLIYFELDLLSTGLNLFLSMVAFRLLLSFLRSGHSFYLFLTGLFYGLSVVCWPLTGTLAIGTMVYLAVYSRKKPSEALKQVILVGLGLSLAILPLSLHNYRAGTPALIATEGAIGLYNGNNPDWLKTSMVRPGYDWERVITLPYRIKGQEEVEKIGVSAIFYQEVKSYIIEQPWQYIRAQLTKLYQLINGYEIINPTDPYFFKQYSSLLNLLIFKLDWLKFPFGLLLPLAMIGITSDKIKENKGVKALLCVHCTAGAFGILIFFISSRYRLFLIPFLVFFAAFGLEQIRRPPIINKGKYIMLLLIGILSYTVSNSDLLGLEKYYSRPQVRSQPYFALGRVLIRQGHYMEALSPLAQAVRIDPDYADAWVDIGRAKFMTGDKPGAIKAMLIANKISPNYSVPLYNLARIYDIQGDSVVKATFYYNAYMNVAKKNYVSKISGADQQRLRTVMDRLLTLNSD